MLQGTRQLEACAFVTVEVEIKSFVMSPFYDLISVIIVINGPCLHCVQR